MSVWCECVVCVCGCVWVSLITSLLPHVSTARMCDVFCAVVGIWWWLSFCLLYCYSQYQPFGVLALIVIYWIVHVKWECCEVYCTVQYGTVQ